MSCTLLFHPHCGAHPLCCLSGQVFAPFILWYGSVPFWVFLFLCLSWPRIWVSRPLSRLRLNLLWSILAFILGRIVSLHISSAWNGFSGKAACPVFDLLFKVGDCHPTSWSKHSAEASCCLVWFYPGNLSSVHFVWSCVIDRERLPYNTIGWEDDGSSHLIVYGRHMTCSH